MSYPHYSHDCIDYHDRVVDWAGERPTVRDRRLTVEPEIVVLCGSTRFKEDFNRVNAEMTLAGSIVISLGVFGHVDMPDVNWETDGCDTKRMLDALHKRKIDLADRVVVINIDGYIGDSTRGEIEYAKLVRKPVSYLVSVPAGEVSA